MVATPNSVFFLQILFLVLCPVAISVATDGNSIGKLESQTIYLDVQNLYGFSSYFFFLTFFLFRYLYFYLFIFRIIVCVYSSLFWYLELLGGLSLGIHCILPSHTHFVHYMSGTLYLDLSCLELEGIV